MLSEVLSKPVTKKERLVFLNKEIRSRLQFNYRRSARIIFYTRILNSFSIALNIVVVATAVCIGLRRQKIWDNFKKVSMGKLLIVLPQVNMYSLTFLCSLVAS